MDFKNGKFALNLICFVLIFIGGFAHPLSQEKPVTSHKKRSQERPNRGNAAAFARWLVSQSSWGVLSTIADDLGGSPFGYVVYGLYSRNHTGQRDVVSYSDGQPYHGTGIPYFYLSSLEPSAHYALKDHRSSFTISEYPLGSCGKVDPENPTCSKITLTGKLNEVDAESEEAGIAKRALFSKHAEMPNWPKDNDFQVYRLDIEQIFLIDFFGGPKPLTVDQYFLPGTDGIWV